MDLKLEIVNAIKEGMRTACSDMHFFTAKPQLCFNAEYLFTVETAKAINNHNFVPAHSFEIRIEHSTRKFARDCLPLIKRGNPMVRGSTIFREKNFAGVKRNGRIDIAVYHERVNSGSFGSIPLCAIEVKGFNPARLLVLEDLRRNLEFLRLIGRTGASQLEFTAFAALHDASQATDFESVHRSLTEVRERYRRWLTELGALSDIVVEIDTFTVSLDSDGTVAEEIEEMVIDLSTRHHFIGVIIIFRKRKTDSNLANPHFSS